MADKCSFCGSGPGLFAPAGCPGFWEVSSWWEAIMEMIPAEDRPGRPWCLRHPDPKELESLFNESVRKAVEDSLIKKAALFARERHAKHVRKYDGRPYYEHLFEVANLIDAAGGSYVEVAAGYLHDTVEDVGVTYEELVNEFGEDVADVVMMVTDVSKPEDGNRKTRKAIDREHLSKADGRGRTVKLADIISNTRDIVKNDPDFAKVYLKEKLLLIPVLRGGNKVLFRAACDAVSEGCRQIGIESSVTQGQS